MLLYLNVQLQCLSGSVTYWHSLFCTLAILFSPPLFLTGVEAAVPHSVTASFPPAAAPGVCELPECWWAVPPQHHTHQRPLLLSYCSAASGRKSLPASSFSVEICCYNGIISKFADSCFKYSLTFLLHRITPFVTRRCCLNSFLKWASACKADAVLFVFPLVQWKWSKRCQQLEGCWVCFYRIDFPQFTCLAPFYRILSCVLVETSFSSFFKGKNYAVSWSLRVDVVSHFLFTWLYRNSRVLFVTKIFVWLTIICIILARKILYWYFFSLIW